MLTHRQHKVMENAFKYAAQRSDIENRAMIKDVARLWPGGKVPYVFASDIGEDDYQPSCRLVIGCFTALNCIALL